MNKASIIGRIVAVGTLKLLSPMLIGAGGEKYSADDSADKVVLCDKDDHPYIPGTSLAGVMHQFADIGSQPDITACLFGSETAVDNEMQSSLIFSDILLQETRIVRRDGVCIDDYTGTGIKGKKFDFELVDRGAKGDFSLQIVLRKIHLDENGNVKQAVRNDIDKLFVKLATGFEIGSGTAKGLGRAIIEKLQVNEYFFSNKEDVVAWLCPTGRRDAKIKYNVSKGQGDAGYCPEDCVIEANFSLPNSLIIRDYDLYERGKIESSLKDESCSVAAVPLKCGSQYVIPGASIKGSLRKHALYIINRLHKDGFILDRLMGPSSEYMEAHKDDVHGKWKSRFSVDEVYIEKDKVKPVVQVRNAIDRFTGGTIQSKLFATQGIYGKDENACVVKIKFVIHSAEQHEVGLALFLLRDLWQGKIALGGEKSIGRGTLQGISANIYFQNEKIQLGQEFMSEDMAKLEQYAAAFSAYNGEAAKR